MATARTDGRRLALRSLTPAASTNAGLWLDQHVNRASEGAVGHAVARVVEDIRVPEGYAAAFARRQRVLASGDGGFDGGVTRFWSAGGRGRIIVGIGLSSIRETGICLLRPWGLPFIPGSALKGVAAATARADGAAARLLDEPSSLVLFGDPAGGGCVVFHDAWWVPREADDRLPIDLDVMTVHHREYYGGGTEPPADSDEPNPIAFVTASGDFTVALSGPDAWVERAGELLTLGLAERGVGAKTASGYGRMTLEAQLTPDQAKAAGRRKELEAKAQALQNVAARYRGAGNANDLVRELLEALLAGVPREIVDREAARLWRREPRFWKKKWRAKLRSAEALDLMGEHLERIEVD
jgi:CRISPR-associated protein Cmr6